MDCPKSSVWNGTCCPEAILKASQSYQYSSFTRIQRLLQPNLFFRSSYLLDLGITPVFVFDGKAPFVKSKTVNDRNEKRFNRPCGNGRERTLLSGLARKCKELLETLGLTCIQALGEAEAVCGWLSAKNVVSGVITEDGDCLLYGARTVYKNFSISAGCTTLTTYEYSEIKDKIGLDRESLIALALLLGCDYCEGVSGVGIQTALKFVKTTTGDEILKRMNSWKNNDSALNISPKLPHCGKCGHPGSIKGHKSKGCHLCLYLRDCQPTPPDFECVCDWHIERRASENDITEYQVRKKSLETPDFPFTAVQKEFLSSYDVNYSQEDFAWKEPNLTKIYSILSMDLGWDNDYCFEKILPIYARWSVVNSKGLKLQRIIKRRKVRFIECYEVEWEKVGVFLEWNCPLISTEPKALLKETYHAIIEDFENLKRKPRKKVICTKVKTPKVRKNIGKGKRISAYFQKNSRSLFAKSPRINSVEGRSLDNSFCNLDICSDNHGPCLQEKNVDSHLIKNYQYDLMAKYYQNKESRPKTSTNDFSNSGSLHYENKEESDFSSLSSSFVEDQSIIIDTIVNRKGEDQRFHCITTPNIASTPKELTNKTSYETISRTLSTPFNPRFNLRFDNLYTPDSRSDYLERSNGNFGSDLSFNLESPLPPQKINFNN
ncbi:hypothetical protein QYM36_002700 [Artemia franciscana]|uniref:XPG-I domain-containing protein n=1 Tax=Artemia franciscana TaxID=6661 RepID=A0AA88IDI6_ARTSF|nr:hypothetical protein QYM36_002700 [Artemia franciscana]